MEALIGINFKKYLTLLNQNRTDIRRLRLKNALMLAMLSIRTSIYAAKENKAFSEEIQSTEIKDQPLFLLGHWRSGTSLLHRLLALDDQFAYPSVFEVYNPLTFLTLHNILAEQLKNHKPEKRPMDNMEVKPTDPGEDEFALSVLSLKSPLLAWSFPENEHYYEKFLTFKDCQEGELNVWKESLLHFLKKLTLKYKKMLVLKSPHHTARIKYLLDLFPEAKFIHIQRNPYRVFSSTRKLYQNTVKHLSLQSDINDRNLEERIIERYKRMYGVFFQEKASIPKKNIYEVRYEDLTTDFEGELKKMYTYFHWPGWEDFHTHLSKYLAANKKYKKNVYDEIEPEWKERIAIEWRKNFNVWGYEL